MHRDPQCDEKINTYLQFGQGETASGADLGVVALRRATDNRAQGSGSRTWEHGLSLLDAVLAPAVLAGRLVEPGANMPLPVLVEVAI